MGLLQNLCGLPDDDGDGDGDGITDGNINDDSLQSEPSLPCKAWRGEGVNSTKGQTTQTVYTNRVFESQLPHLSKDYVNTSYSLKDYVRTADPTAVVYGFYTSTPPAEEFDYNNLNGLKESSQDNDIFRRKTPSPLTDLLTGTKNTDLIGGYYRQDDSSNVEYKTTQKRADKVGCDELLLEDRTTQFSMYHTTYQSYNKSIPLSIQSPDKGFGYETKLQYTKRNADVVGRQHQQCNSLIVDYDTAQKQDDTLISNEVSLEDRSTGFSTSQKVYQTYTKRKPLSIQLPDVVGCWYRKGDLLNVQFDDIPQTHAQTIGFNEFSLEDRSNEPMYHTPYQSYNKSSPLSIPLPDKALGGFVKPQYTVLQTDGPLLNEKEVFALQQSETQNHSKLQESPPYRTSFQTYSQHYASPSLSLSPLGPKRIPNLDGCKNATLQAGPLVRGIAFPHANITSPIRTVLEDLRIGRCGIQTRGLRYDGGYDETHTSSDVCCLGTSPLKNEACKCKPVYNNTRRSLVGSFEESLLSGRLLMGKSCQVFILVTI